VAALHAAAPARLIRASGPEGISRQTVLDLAAGAAIPAVVRDLSLAEMYAADDVFWTGTIGGIAGVTMIDGRPIGTGRTYLRAPVPAVMGPVMVPRSPCTHSAGSEPGMASGVER
jgi:hypothetical protein